jgi:hypothetical protein
MVPEGRCLVRLSDAGQHPRFGLALIGLHPDQGVEQVSHFLSPGTVPLDDQERAARRDLDRSFPAAPGPARRAAADRPALVQGHQDSFY